MRPMNNNDQKLLTELKKPPLGQNGFDDQLKSRIMQQLDEKPQRHRLWLVPVLTLVCITLLGLFLPIQWSNISPDSEFLSHSSSTTTSNEHNSANDQQYDSMQANFDSALLIGFRKDGASFSSSVGDDVAHQQQYRTILIAEQGSGQIGTVAEGEGLLVPYGQQFWYIDSPYFESDEGKLQYVTSSPIQSMTSDAHIVDIESIDNNYLERILFAGNQYISMEIKSTTSSDKKSNFTEMLWTGTLDDLVNRRPQMMFDDFDFSTSTSIELLASTTDTQEKTDLTSSLPEQWGIIRSQGKWIPVTMASSQFETVPLELTENVVSHDELCCDWQDVLSIEPEALDALSSPLHDVIAILTADKLSVHPLYDDVIQSDVLFEIPIDPEETLVMAQWATNNYVSLWSETVANYFNKFNSAHVE